MRILAAVFLACLFLAPRASSQFSWLVDPKGQDLLVTVQMSRSYMRPHTPAPSFSADQVTEHTQTLPDGTHVTRPPSVQHFFQDAEGRARVELPLLQPQNAQTWNPMLIEIRDPVSGFCYVMLDGEPGIAHRYALPATERPAQPNRQPPPVAPPPVAPPVAAVTSSEPSGPKILHETLPNQTIEGLTVHGTRVTSTHPAGSQGNDQPLTISNEIWSSPELGIIMIAKYTDPRIGERTFKTVNVDRSPPDPALFAPPPDYTIIDEKGPFAVTLKRPHASDPAPALPH